MATKVVSILTEYKEIIILLLAVGTIIAARPTAPVTLEQLSAKVDALMRLQCVTVSAERLTLAGITCTEK